MRSNLIGQNRKTEGDHDEDCIEEGFQLAKIKYDRDSEGGREALGVTEIVREGGKLYV